MEINKTFLNKKYTNILKGIAILCVLVNHIGQRFNIGIVEPLGTFGVCLFLILSAYGLNMSVSNKGLNGYIKKRFKRVVIPYWIIVIIFSVITKAGFINFICYLFLIKLPTNIFWYIRLTIYWYIVYYFICHIENKVFKYLITFAMSILISLIFIDNKVYIYQILSFLLGVLLSEYKDLITRSIIKYLNKYITMSFVGVIIFAVLKKVPYVDNNTYGVLDISIGILLNLALTVFVSIILIKIYNLNILKIVGNIGIKSYEIYLVHPFLLFTVTNIKSLVLYLVFVYIATLIFSKLIKRLV